MNLLISVNVVPAPFFVAAAGAFVCAVTDLRTGYIFDRVTGTTLCLTLAAAFLSGSGAGSVAGACITSLLLYAVHALTCGRGIGLGDVKLAACLGAGLGMAGGLLTIGAAFIAGGAYGAALLAARRATGKSAIRFGPFLAGGYATVGAFACFR